MKIKQIVEIPSYLVNSTYALERESTREISNLEVSEDKLGELGYFYVDIEGMKKNGAFGCIVETLGYIKKSEIELDIKKREKLDLEWVGKIREEQYESNRNDINKR